MGAIRATVIWVILHYRFKLSEIALLFEESIIGGDEFNSIGILFKKGENMEKLAKWGYDQRVVRNEYDTPTNKIHIGRSVDQAMVFSWYK